MKLLTQYIKVVKWYLPREHREDIINELSENLLSKMEEVEAEFGRPLTEPEQEALLREHGEPMEVAGRYGANQRCVTFGRQLIGPALYPIYLWVLWLHWGVAFLIHTYMAIFKGSLGIGAFLITVGCQFFCVTLVFTILDIYHRKSLQFWCFHSEHLKPISRWQSAFGLILWSIYSCYWAVVPHYPSLIYGNAPGVRLGPVWHTFYWPILLLLLAGVAQRAINLLYPAWNWLQPAVRLVVNIISISMLYFLVNAGPYILTDNIATVLPEAERLASRINTIIRAALLFGFSIYWLANTCGLIWLCMKHARYRLSRRNKRAELPQ
jgi:hypothetical protein